MINTYQRTALVLGLLLIHLALLMSSTWKKSPTCDEFGHLSFGLGYLNKGRLEKAIAQRMPVSIMNALPVKFFGSDNDVSLNNKTVSFTCRVPTMVASILLCLTVLFWSTRLYGWHGGLFSLALCSFSPNIIAHGRLITTDIYASLAVTLACYAFWCLCRRPSASTVLLSAATLGLAQAVKFSAVVLVPTFAVIIMLPGVRGGVISAIRKRSTKWLWLALYPVVAFFSLGVAYGLDDMLNPLSAFSFYSDSFSRLQARLPFLILPLPRVYIEGLDIIRHMSIHPGVQRGPNYLFGQVNNEGWWFYYIVVCFLKIPLGFLALLTLRLITRLRGGWHIFGRKSEKHFGANGFFLLIPALALLTFFSLFSTVQIGIRHVLPALTLLYIYAGGMMTVAHREKAISITPDRRIPGVCWILLASGAISSLAVFPDYISYTNELMVPKIYAYRIMADSNLDWGQDRYFLQEYLDAHPEAIANPRKPVFGHIIVRINRLVGVSQGDRYRWLRVNHRPIEVFHGSHLVYHIEANKEHAPDKPSNFSLLNRFD